MNQGVAGKAHFRTLTYTVIVYTTLQVEEKCWRREVCGLVTEDKGPLCVFRRGRAFWGNSLLARARMLSQRPAWQLQRL